MNKTKSRLISTFTTIFVLHAISGLIFIGAITPAFAKDAAHCVTHYYKKGRWTLRNNCAVTISIKFCHVGKQPNRCGDSSTFYPYTLSSLKPGGTWSNPHDLSAPPLRYVACTGRRKHIEITNVKYGNHRCIPTDRE